MRFGCCAGLASFVPPTLDGQQDSLSVAHAAQCAEIPGLVGALADAGFDFVEFGVGMTVPEQPEENFRRFLAEVEWSPLKAEVFNSFIPAWIKVVGPDVDGGRVESYVNVAVERVARAGGKCIVFGSGGARTCPDGWDKAEAAAQLTRFIHLAADHCERHNVVLCLEPLNAGETNMINRVSEASAWARLINRSSVRVLADCFHMGMEREPYSSVLSCGSLLAHAHVADQGRRYPADFGYDIDGFFAALREAGYDGRVSIEANFEDVATEAPLGLERIRRAVS